MPEEHTTEPAAMKWLRQYAVAAWTTAGSAALVLLITVLKEKIGSDLEANIAKAVIASVVIGAWIYELRIRNLRSTTSKLEGEIHSLRVRPSLALKEISESDKILIEVSRSGEAYERFSEMIGISQIKVDDYIHKLTEAGMIEFHLGGEWESNSHYGLTPSGRSYLVDQHLVE